MIRFHSSTKLNTELNFAITNTFPFRFEVKENVQSDDCTCTSEINKVTAVTCLMLIMELYEIPPPSPLSIRRLIGDNIYLVGCSVIFVLGER